AGKISLDMLEEHIYGDRSKDRKIRYWRRRKLRKALEEIGKLSNWQITEVRKGVYELKREEKKA
ncbi:replication protein C, IncQ-type, partial [Desulfonauticus submarinus]